MLGNPDNPAESEGRFRFPSISREVTGPGKCARIERNGEAASMEKLVWEVLELTRVREVEPAGEEGLFPDLGRWEETGTIPNH